MDKQRVLAMAIFSALILVLPEPSAHEVAQVVSPQALARGWRATAHVSSNAYYLSLPDLFLSTLGGPIGTKAHALIFFFGLTAALHFSPLASFLATAIALKWFGADQLVIPSISLVPWLAYCLEKHWIMASAASFALSMSAQFQSLLAVMFALVMAAVRFKPVRPLSLACAVLSALIVLVSAPSIPFPDYPADAHVVPDDGVPGIMRPLVGVDPLVPSMNRGAIKTGLAAPAKVLLIVSLALVAVHRSRSRLLAAAMALAVFSYIDTWISEGISQIGPVAALGRLLPNVFVMPSTMLWLAFAMVLVIEASDEAARARLKKLSALGPFLCALCLALWSPVLSRFLSPDILREPALAASPSLYLMRTAGTEIVNRRSTLENARFSGLKSSAPAIISNPPVSSEELAALADRRDRDRRWTPGRGEQRGDEWLHIMLRDERRIDGVELDPGAYASDFPRGISVAVSTDCKVNDFGTYSEVLRLPEWLGPVRFSPAGFPYFGAQSEVQAFFPKTVSARCILIRQIGTEPYYDWSVTEVRLLAAR